MSLSRGHKKISCYVEYISSYFSHYKHTHSHSQLRNPSNYYSENFGRVMCRWVDGGRFETQTTRLQIFSNSSSLEFHFLNIYSGGRWLCSRKQLQVVGASSLLHPIIKWLPADPVGIIFDWKWGTVLGFIQGARSLLTSECIPDKKDF